MSVEDHAKVLASQHWKTYVVKILELHGEDPIVTEKCGFYFLKGFMLGFYYGSKVNSDEVEPIILACAYWWNLEFPIVESCGFDEDVIGKCMVHYRLAFVHGFKHGKEAVEFHL